MKLEFISTRQDYRIDEDSSLFMVLPTIILARAWDGSRTLSFSWLYWSLLITKYKN